MLTHVVFSTHQRIPIIVGEMRPELHAYLGGFVGQLHGVPVRVGGTNDHVHILVCLPGELAISDCVRVLKTNSSRWMHDKTQRRSFAWQVGFGAFSVSESSRQQVADYIANQEKHHARVSFQDEFMHSCENTGSRMTIDMSGDRSPCERKNRGMDTGKALSPLRGWASSGRSNPWLAPGATIFRRSAARVLRRPEHRHS